MTSNCEIWLTFNGESEKIQIPVNPEEIKVKNGKNNDSIDIVKTGEVTILQGPAAKVYSFSSIFPARKFYGMQVEDVTDPMTLVNKIEGWKKSELRLPVHFICTKLKINEYCSIEDFEYSEKGGDVGTIYYSIELKEYKDPKVRSIEISGTGGTTATVDNGEERVTTRQTFAPGDIVTFSGGYHYYWSGATEDSGWVEGGQAIIQAVSDGEHKYAIIGGAWRDDVDGDCLVYGWVDESTIS